MDMKINSPFRYAGGKFYARNLILEHIQPHDTYIEVFAGGGSIFFAKNKAKRNWLNDIDNELVNCYTIIRDRPQELIELLKGEQALKERHHFFKNEYQPSNELERAYRWFYLNRTSYSGIMNMKNCYWGYGDKFSMRPENWANNIMRTSLKLQGVELTCLDFETLIDNLPENENIFLFLDPPYFNADQDKFYAHFFSNEDHIRLQNVLLKNQHKFNFLLTYDNTEEVRTLYNWTSVMLDKEWNYTINRTDDQSKNGKTKPKKDKGVRYKGKEVFILNYQTQTLAEKQLALF
ncbi:MAG: DNA adenine methylase [Bacteroidia bacterium]